MRSAGNFNSEWGYLAPAPSFMRTARVVLVATAIGATAGAAVVLSLIDRPTARHDKTASIAAHAIVSSVQAAAATTAAPASSASAAPVSVTAAVPATATPVAAAAPAPVAPQMAPTAMLQAAPQTEPQVAVQPSPAATPSPAIAPPASATKPAIRENSAARDAVVAPASKPASGIASLSDVAPASEAAPDETSDQALIPPQTVPPEKKPKHHAAYASNTKYKPVPGLGSVLRRLFNPHVGPTNYPNR